MNTPIDRLIEEVTSATLEKLAFVFASPMEDRAGEDPADLLAARVEFSGPFKGAMELRMSDPAVGELATNMLGLDEGAAPTPAERCDALKELLNVICGNVLPAVAGVDAEFNLKAPSLIDPAETAAAAAGETDTAQGRLQLDNGFCAVTLEVEGRWPQAEQADPL